MDRPAKVCKSSILGKFDLGKTSSTDCVFALLRTFQHGTIAKLQARDHSDSIRISVLHQESVGGICAFWRGGNFDGSLAGADLDGAAIGTVPGMDGRPGFSTTHP